MRKGNKKLMTRGLRAASRLLAGPALLAVAGAAAAQYQPYRQFGIRSGEAAGFADRGPFSGSELYLRSPALNFAGGGLYPDYAHLEAAILEVERADDATTATLFGPVLGWRLPVPGLAFELSLRPTWLSDSVIADFDMGGNFHFTSHVGLAWRVTDRFSASARIQHTSNGGIRDVNPGLDLQMLELAYRF